MSRFIVPVSFVALVSGLGLGLIVGIVARSPETHANLYPEGFDRTPIAYVGAPIPFAGVGLTAPGLANAAEPVARGRLLFVGNDCATCHGVASEGGVVGPRLDLAKLELWLEDFRAVVRSGPGGMPAFTEPVLGDDDIESIYAYLKALRQGSAAALGAGAP